MVQKCKEENIDVCLVSEPPVRIDGLIGYWSSDRKALIIINNFVLKIKGAGEGAGYVMVDVNDMLFIAMYFSPNKKIDSFLIFWNEIMSQLRKRENTQCNKVILAGDINAHNRLWGSKKACKRGKLIFEWLIEEQFVCLNDGIIPTFSSHLGNSYVDVTFAFRAAASDVKMWAVEEKENMSYHNNIMFTLTCPKAEHTKHSSLTGFSRGNVGPKRNKIIYYFINAGRALLENTSDIDLNSVMTMLEKACKKYLGKRKKNTGQRSAYWWDRETKEQWALCNKLKRKMKRLKKVRERRFEEYNTAVTEYKDCKKKLKNIIKRKKNEAWDKLLRLLNEDIWGRAYRIVLNKWKKKNPLITLQEGKIIIKGLFPNGDSIPQDDLEDKILIRNR
ncbi:uncharacterized protein LOC143264086 [Megachile rotundata]|uniref:uncharacterized protein LOC143264086 n=1 Tax=Megachile rotundata TaxID=143995 RepID=UPI003FD47371